MTKISSMTALLGAGVTQADDLIPIVDMSEAGAARNKKITVAELLALAFDRRHHRLQRGGRRQGRGADRRGLRHLHHL